MLQTETDTPAMRDRVHAAACARFDLEPNEVLYEHGQWWVKFWPEGTDENIAAFEEVFGTDVDEKTFSVVDAEGGESVDGFDFEEV